MSEFQLTIDGKKVTAQKGDTVLDVARKTGIKIPTYCSHPDLEPYGACRLCIVKVEGIRGFPTSCTTPATEGMKVETTTPEIITLRRNVLKLMLSGHTSPCIVCLHKELCEKYRPNPTKAGRTTRCGTCSARQSCELRELSKEYEIDELDVPIIYKDIPVERNDPFMDRNYSLCVLCGMCVRICEKLHDKPAISFIGRGETARIGTVNNKNHTETNCEFCGACVDICPTGSLTDRYAKWSGEADKKEQTTCTLCPIGCSLNVLTKEDKVISAQATAFNKESRICAVGRFVYPQLFDSPARLKSHAIRLEDGERKATYDEAVAQASEKLKKFTGSQFAMIAHPSALREDIFVMEKFTKDVMKSDHFSRTTVSGEKVIIESPAVKKGIQDGTIKAVFTTGDYLAEDLLSSLSVVITADAFPSKVTQKADVVFACAILAETDGTFVPEDGQTRELKALAKPLEYIYSDWKIICDVAQAMGASGFNFKATADITKKIVPGDAVAVEKKNQLSPLDDISALPKFYRGHLLSDIVCALKSIISKQIPGEKDSAKKVDEDLDEKPFKIIVKEELVPDTHMLTVYAPVVAANCKPGQFVIAMANEFSERIPYTIADWDKEEGTITFNVLEAGRSSREVALLKVGDHLAHLVGPLGMPVEVKNYGTVLLGGGCYGVGAMLPIARAMKEAGNKVICIDEASSHYLLYWQDKLSENCDELIEATMDGSVGVKGGVKEAVKMLQARGEKIDQAFFIGCTFMMMIVSDQTKEYGIPTLTAMNPLMLDGTGMCGACRVTVGDSTKFACVDGPFLDGHQINWIELMQRLSAFRPQEVHALGQDDAQHEHKCRQ